MTHKQPIPHPTHSHYFGLIVVGLLALLASLTSCEEDKKPVKAVAYKGPIEEINNVKLLYSESAMMRVKLTTERQLRFINDDRKYPKEVFIDFYDPTGSQIVTTLRSDSGKYDKAKDLYTVMGHVVVINKAKQEKLQTNLLNWNPNTKKVYTETRVVVSSQLTGEKLYGLGLDANQDFSRYSIRKPTGVFNLEGGI
ncbi:LPS export ABC transporter periplasmic protein LptC [Fibrella forsythiae]|uniref:LPS export ABC transporter periplasmic protein LptC n=1 Tax=Fibrella forsythiae TaxID=2817061 RepID=A0ABS3JGH7_9BACT|nr:LPS export ABC transporter periplasmic protein LptC [Fibrella forsythiae]MBO0949098.1 LPS export ABC transporter periplasmic protein LptC [Fibrella forsythiae]